MRFVLGVIGAVVASGIVTALDVRSGIVRAVAAAVGLGCGWLVYGFIEERQERKRIEYELEQDRIRYEQERQK